MGRRASLGKHLGRVLMLFIQAQEILGNLELRAHARIDHDPYQRPIEPVTVHVGHAALDLASALNAADLADVVRRVLLRRDRVVQTEMGGWRALL